MKPLLCLELNVTRQCNFRCNYCVEKKAFKNDYVTGAVASQFVEFVEKVRASQFYEQNFSAIQIKFWGGEPTLSTDTIRTVMSKLTHIENISFGLFTNGSDLDGIRKLDKEHLTVQVSYDGNPLHDRNRKARGGGKTSAKVRETICTLIAEGYRTIIQSTLPLSGFKDMPQCYDDMRSLYALIRRIQPDYKMQYNPALTYLSPFEATQEDLNVMRDSLLEIAKKDLSFYDEENTLFFGWFSKRKLICSAGESLYTVDLDGDVYACHGTLYHDKPSHKITSILSADFEAHLWKSRSGFKSAAVPDECRNCYVDYCTRCQAMAYSLSKKQSYLERWYDFPAKSMCSIYQINHNVNQVLRAIIRGA